MFRDKVETLFRIKQMYSFDSRRE